MVECKCQVCGDVMGFLSSDELKKMLASGEVVKATRFFRGPDWRGDEIDKHEDGYFGVCRRCKRRHADAPLLGNDAEFARHKRIMDRLAHIRRNSPDMPLDEATTRATEDEFEAANEANVELRRYLMERLERDAFSAERDEIARRILANLPEDEA